MSRKGRRGRSNKGSSVAAQQVAGGAQVVASPEMAPAAVEDGVPGESPEPTSQRETAVPLAAQGEPAISQAEPVAMIPEPVRPRAETPVAFAQTDEGEAPVVAEVQQVAASRGVDRDDSSYPPVDLDTHFFDGQGHSRDSEPSHELDDRDPRMTLKRTPEVARRRADLQRYVKIAVAAASALCLAALVKVAVAHSATDDGHTRPAPASAAALHPVQTTVQATPEPLVAPPPAAPAPPPPAAEPPVASPPAEIPAAAAPAAETAPAAAPVAAAPAEAAPAAAPAEAASAPSETVELDPKAAAKEKNTCRAALERGKLADAIAAGEKSVALDPTDSEAWLILGASYQEKGDMKNARRSYKACIEQGKRGPKYECAAMPH